MDARYTIRKAQLLEECQVAPKVFEQVLPRLHTFMEPFVDTLHGQAPRGGLDHGIGHLASMRPQHISDSTPVRVETSRRPRHPSPGITHR